jgi:hypothetical protein
MKMLRMLLVVAVLTLAVSVLPAPAQLNLQRPVLATLHISDLAGAKLRPLIGHQIILDGYYSDTSVPMIVDDYRRVSLTIQDPGHFQPIVGKVPANVKAGDHITWTYNIRTPRATDPVHVQRLPGVLEPVIAAGIATRVATPAALSKVFINNVARYLGPPGNNQHYAVLIGGGYDATSNFQCFWTDIQSMYKYLRAAGYPAANIYVLYWNGTGLTTDVPVNYSDTSANVKTVFQTLAGKMGFTDSLYVETDCHGAGFLKQADGPDGPGMYCGRVDNNSWAAPFGPAGTKVREMDNVADNLVGISGNGTVGIDEGLGMEDGSTFYDKDFAADVNSIKYYSKMVFNLNQCFSAGFIEDLMGPQRVLMSCASENSCGHAGSPLEPFVDKFLAALQGTDPATGQSVNADTNHDGKVSILEAYLYARPFVTNCEEPQYSDDGSGVPVDIPGQGNSQGAFGSTCFMPL